MSHDKQENQEIQPCRKSSSQPIARQQVKTGNNFSWQHTDIRSGKPGTYLTQHGKSNNGGQAADRKCTPHRKPVATDAVRQSRPSRRSDGIRNDRRFVPAPWRISEATKTRGNGVPDHALPCTPKSSAIHERRRRRIYERGGSRLPFRILTFLGSPTNAPDRPALISQASLGCLPRPDRPDRASARRPTASWRRPR